MSDQSIPQVYKAIAAVMSDLSKEGIGKDRKNSAQGYNFRGVDDVYNALSSVLSKHGLTMLPRVLNRVADTRESAKGGALYWVVVEVEFDLVCAADGSMHTIKSFGEAMDSADKATNKAMSAAYKYAAFQAFCIPTEGDNDADAHTPQPAKGGKRVDDGEPWLLSIGLNQGGIRAYRADCEQKGLDWEETAKNARGAQVRDGAGLGQYVTDLMLRKEAVPS